MDALRAPLRLNWTHKASNGSHKSNIPVSLHCNSEFILQTHILHYEWQKSLKIIWTSAKDFLTQTLKNMSFPLKCIFFSSFSLLNISLFFAQAVYCVSWKKKT